MRIAPPNPDAGQPGAGRIASSLLAAALLGAGCDREPEQPAPVQPPSSAAPRIQAADRRPPPAALPSPRTAPMAAALDLAQLDWPSLRGFLDLDSDGRVTPRDVARYRAGMAPTETYPEAPAPQEPGLPDLDGDGRIGPSDALTFALAVGMAAEISGLLDFDGDGAIGASDYRFAADPLAALAPVLGPEAAGEWARGARAWLVPPGRTNLAVAPFGEGAGWTVRVEIPGLRLDPPGPAGGAWRLARGDAADGEDDTAVAALEIRTLGAALVRLVPRGEPGRDALPVPGDEVVWAGQRWAVGAEGLVPRGRAATGPQAAARPLPFPLSFLRAAHARREDRLPLLRAFAVALESELALVRAGGRDLDRTLGRLERRLATARKADDPRCRPRCEALAPLLADAAALAGAANGAGHLARIAVRRAEAALESEQAAGRELRRLAGKIRSVLAWKRGAVFVGEAAADLLEALVTGNPKELAAGTVNALVGLGTGYALGHQRLLAESAAAAMPGPEQLKAFAGSLSGGLAALGAVEVKGGKLVFHPSMGGGNLARELETLRALRAKETLNEAERFRLQKARAALMAPLVKGLIAAATASAVSRSEDDLRRARQHIRDSQLRVLQLRVIAQRYELLADRELPDLRGAAYRRLSRVEALAGDCRRAEGRARCERERAAAEAEARRLLAAKAELEERHERLNRALSEAYRELMPLYDEVLDAHRAYLAASRELHRLRLHADQEALWRRILEFNRSRGDFEKVREFEERVRSARAARAAIPRQAVVVRERREARERIRRRMAELKHRMAELRAALRESRAERAARAPELRREAARRFEEASRRYLACLGAIPETRAPAIRAETVRVAEGAFVVPEEIFRLWRERQAQLAARLDSAARQAGCPDEAKPEAATVRATTPFGGATGEIAGEVFHLAEGTDRLPDFERLRPVGRLRTDRFDVPERAFDQGFPGVTDRFEWFGLRYRGGFMVRRAGRYRFRLVSDDGARLIIDGRTVLDNDGVHPPKAVEGEVRLTAGVHALELQYFQGPRYHVALQLQLRCGEAWRTWTTALLAGEEGAACALDTPGGGAGLVFDTNWGRMTLEPLPGGGYRGRYTHRAGRIVLRPAPDGSLTGYWTQGGAKRRCEKARDGRHHWGWVRLRLTADLGRVEGEWGYCGDPEAMGDWRGTRVGGGAPGR